jgi:hypothetical protein
MKILDCETLDSTYESLDHILNVSRTRLEHLFENFDVDGDHRGSSQIHRPPEDLLLAEVERMAAGLVGCNRACWFHLTRVNLDSSFSDGILPLGTSLDRIWDFLGSLVGQRISPGLWTALRRDMGSSPSAGLYHMKVANMAHWGPFASLVRDHAFSTQETGCHDYLCAPEIVEDICRCFSDRSDFDLLESFKVNTRSCIVKFVVDTPRADCVRAAVYHLYNRARRFNCSIGCNTCYNGQGVPVRPDQILKVEFDPTC